MKSSGAWDAQPGRGLVEAGQLAGLDAIQEGRPAGHLAFVEAVGVTEVSQPLGLPVDLREPGDALHQLEGQAPAGLQVGVERLGPDAVGAHGRPAVHEAHEVEGAAEHRGVGAQGDGLGVGDVGAVEGLDDAPLAHDALVPIGHRGGRRDADGAVHVAATHLVDLVLAAAGDVAVLDRRADAQALGVHPGGQLVHPGQGGAVVVGRVQRFSEVAHRFPTSSSR